MTYFIQFLHYVSKNCVNNPSLLSAENYTILQWTIEIEDHITKQLYHLRTSHSRKGFVFSVSSKKGVTKDHKVDLSQKLLDDLNARSNHQYKHFGQRCIQSTFVPCSLFMSVDIKRKKNPPLKYVVFCNDNFLMFKFAAFIMDRIQFVCYKWAWYTTQFQFIQFDSFQINIFA